jgi:hypothetical protein
MTVTETPQACECARQPWVTIDMLGGIAFTGGDGTSFVRCPDREHCLRGAPVIDGRLGEHWRNIETPCRWTGLRVRESAPCACGGRPWVRSEMLRMFFHKDLKPASPLRSASCPGCRNSLVEVEHNRFTTHLCHADQRCPWSGIFLAIGSRTPPALAAPTVR